MVPTIRKIVVVGGGSAGFLSALTLKTMLPELHVTVVHSSRLPPIGVGESTTSQIPRFLHGGLGIDQQSFYRNVRPTWKLGIRFEDWGESDTERFYYPFDKLAVPRDQPLGKEEAYYYFADGQVSTQYTALMDVGKSPCFPKPDGSISMDPTYGYHIESRRFIEYLETVAAQRGVTVVDRQVLNVTVGKVSTEGRQSERPIESVQLDNHTALTADLFIDCTGFSSRLLGESLAEPFIRYNRSLFCDTAITSRWQRSTGVRPYTNCRTMDHGWCWNIELADHVSCGYVYSSQFCTADEAATEMRTVYPQMDANADQESEDFSDFEKVEFRSGRHERFWVNNVAAIGNALGFVEPLESTGLHMIAVTARTLGQALVDNDCRVTPSMRNGINNYIGQMWDDIRDNLALHFAFNRSRDTPFWRHCRSETDLAGASSLIDFYIENGPSSLGAHLLPQNSIFRHDGYLSILIGQRVPSSYSFEPSADERQRWRRILQHSQNTASAALSMDDGLRLALRST